MNVYICTYIHIRVHTHIKKKGTYGYRNILKQNDLFFVSANHRKICKHFIPLTTINNILSDVHAAYDIYNEVKNTIGLKKTF